MIYISVGLRDTYWDNLGYMVKLIEKDLGECWRISLQRCEHQFPHLQSHSAKKPEHEAGVQWCTPFSAALLVACHWLPGNKSCPLEALSMPKVLAPAKLAWPRCSGRLAPSASALLGMRQASPWVQSVQGRSAPCSSLVAPHNLSCPVFEPHSVAKVLASAARGPLPPRQVAPN